MRARMSALIVESKSFRTRGMCASQVARNLLYVPGVVSLSLFSVGCMSLTSGRLILELCTFPGVNVDARGPCLETMTHGGGHQTYEDFIYRIEECIVKITSHLDPSKIFTEYYFRNFFRAEVSFVLLSSYEI